MGEIAIGLVVRAVRRHALLFVLVSLLATGAAYLALRSPPLYTATAVVRLSGERQAVAAGAGVEEVVPELDRNTRPVLSLVPRLSSRTVVGMVVDSLNLRLRRIRPSGLSDWLGSPFASLVKPLLSSDTDLFPEWASHVEFKGVAIGRSPSPDTLSLVLRETDLIAQRGRTVIRAAYGERFRIGPVQLAVAAPKRKGRAMIAVVPRDVAIDGILTKLGVVPVMGTDAVQVKYTDTSPVRAQRVANLVVENFLATSVRAKQEEAGRRRRFLTEQLQATDSLLANAERRLAAFRSRQRLGTSTEWLGLQQSASMALEGRRGDLEADRRVYQTLLTRLQSSDNEVREEAIRTLPYTPEIAGDPVTLRLYQQLLGYRSRLDSLTTGRWKSADGNPDVVQLKEFLKGTQQELQRNIQAHLASVTVKISALADRRAANEARLRTLPGLQADEMRLSQQVASLGVMADQLRLEVQKSRMSEQLAAVDVDVVDLANRPYQPVGVPWWLKGTVALVFGLLTASALSTITELRDRRIHAPQELERVLQTRSLGIIPKFSAPTGETSLLTPRQHLTDDLLSRSRPGSAHAAEQELLLVDAFRLLCSNLALQWTNRHRTVLVTSVGPREGKTLVSANLALAFAREGARVLLVDCDVRRSRLHRVFGIPRSPGLMELLAAATPAAENGGMGERTVNGADVRLAPTAPDLAPPLPDHVKGTGFKGVFLLPCGKPGANQSVMLQARAVRTVLESFSANFDVVIIDTSPVVVSADAPVLATLADDVLMVVRVGHTNRDELEEVSKTLTAAGAHVVGAVLNDHLGQLPQSRSRYYGYTDDAAAD